MPPSFFYETRLWKQGYLRVAGADEVGRGAFAGPVVAAAVVFHKSFLKEVDIDNLPVVIDDSKTLKPRQREKAASWIKAHCWSWGIGEVGVSFINRLGMARASKMAFRKALKECSQRLGQFVDFLLVDAFFVPYLAGLRRKNQKAIIGGDSKSFSIAAASILAKVYRDALMRKLARRYKLYGWGRNKGYGTCEHQAAIKKYGITRQHRKSFVANILAREKEH